MIGRPLNALIAAAVVAVGSWLGGYWGPRTLAASAAGFFLTLWANIHNDLEDLELDRRAHPGRPLPSGRLSPRAAGWLSLGFLILSFALAALTNPPAWALFTGAALLVYSYNTALKRIPFWGNLAVALASAAGFAFGGLLGPNVGRALWASLFALLLHLARELVKDAEDAEADKGFRVSLPILWPKGRVLALLSFYLAALALAAPLPWLLGHYSWRYAAVALPLVALPSLAALPLAKRERWPEARKLLKAVMAPALLALLLA